jgi:hypothetical protein
LDKVNFKLTLIKCDIWGHSILIKGEIHQKGNNNYQLICTQCQRIQFHQTYFEGPKNIYNLQHSSSGRLEYCPITNR